MQITLELTPTQGALLKALSPRGAAVKTATPLEGTALRILADGMQREARLRRVTSSQVDVAALTQAAQRRRERMP